MLQGQNVDVLSVCTARGAIRPLRLRLDTGAEPLRVEIDEILSEKEIAYVGVEAKIFLCRARVGGSVRTLELRYNIRAHTWSLTRAAI
ncbi:MAG: hypothetical protein LUH51_00680 [Firmicutes bacterium]|nr:hypothetical protein [Bacillota bacterium]